MNVLKLRLETNLILFCKVKVDISLMIKNILIDIFLVFDFGKYCILFRIDFCIVFFLVVFG